MPSAPTWSGTMPNAGAFDFSQRIATFTSAIDAGYCASGGMRKSIAITAIPSSASASWIALLLSRSFEVQPPPCTSTTAG